MRCRVHWQTDKPSIKLTMASLLGLVVSTIVGMVIVQLDVELDRLFGTAEIQTRSVYFKLHNEE